MDVAPLICAECAEKRQSPKEYDEVVWEEDKSINGYRGIPTKNKLPLPKWTINKEGKVPSYNGPGPHGFNDIMTDQLIVDLSKDFDKLSSGETTMIPAVPYTKVSAIPDEEDNFWGYSVVPENLCEWWRKLPTR